MILYIAERQKAGYIECYGTPEERFRYLPPGVDPKFRLYREDEKSAVRIRIRREFGLPDDAVLLIQICSAFHTKGVDRVIQALAALPEVFRKKVFYLVAGTETKGFRKIAVRSGLDRQVIFAGPRQDVPDLLTAADLMVHPARTEAAGTVLAEAAVCGLPMICSANCGFAPLTAEAGGIVLPEPFSCRSLTEALELTFRLPDALDRMRSDAAEYALKADFHHRTECFWNFIEEDGHA